MVTMDEAREEADRLIDHIKIRLREKDPDSVMLTIHMVLLKVLDDIMDNVNEEMCLQHLDSLHYLIDHLGPTYMYRAQLPKDKRFVTGGNVGDKP